MCWFFTHIIYIISILTNKQRSRNYFKSVSGHVTFSCFSRYTSSLAKKCRLDLFRKDTHFPMVQLQPTGARPAHSGCTGVGGVHCRGPLHSIYAVSPVKLPLVHMLYMYSEARLRPLGTAVLVYINTLFIDRVLFIWSSLCICSRSEMSQVF